MATHPYASPPPAWVVALALALPSLSILPSCSSTNTGSPGDGTSASSTSAGSSASNASSGSSKSGSSASASAGWYSVNGPTIYAPDGTPHLFRGLDRPSLESSSGGTSLSEGDYEVMGPTGNTPGIQSWNGNVVRIALNQDFWLSGAPQYDSTYPATVDQQVKWAEKHGLDVILDLHWSDGGNYGTPGQQQMADQHSVTFWGEVATVYANDPHVLFELYNEPVLYNASDPWGVWLNGGDTGSGSGLADVPNAAGMSALYAAVRAVAPKNLVVIGGIHYAFDLSGVPTHPIQGGTNIIYATHPYNNAAEKDPSNWYTAFGSLAATAPVMATEFGDQQNVANAQCNTSYITEFMQYADLQNPSGTTAPANKLSWSAWAFIVTSTADECEYPTLLDSYYVANVNGMAVMSALNPM